MVHFLKEMKRALQIREWNEKSIKVKNMFISCLK